MTLLSKYHQTKKSNVDETGPSPVSWEIRIEYRFGGFEAVGRCPILFKSEWSLAKVASNPGKQNTLHAVAILFSMFSLLAAIRRRHCIVFSQFPCARR
uniref:Uncharacterized protein n=1 Tax=Caenorhabditis japonica TaxID=281687 RepID=A0A8R1E8K3_CAEJA